MTSYEIDYSPKVNNHSTIAYRKVSAQGISTGISLSSSGVYGAISFIIPPSCFNPAKSRLNFQLEFSDPGTSVNIAWLNANILTLFNRIVVADSSTGATLMDVSSFEKYASQIVPAATSIDEFLTKNSCGNLGVLGMTGASANSTPFPYEDICKSNSLVNYSFQGVDLGGTSGANAYVGRRQLYSGINSEKAFIDFSIPFSAFKHTFLGIDKVFFSPSNITVDFYISPFDNFCWKSTSVTAPQTGASSTTGVTLNNLQMILANEANLSLINDIQNKVMSSGLNMLIPYPTVTRQVVSASSAHSYNLNLTRSYGNRILYIATSPFDGGTDINNKNSHQRGLLSNYSVYLNNIAEIQSPVDCTKGEDYMLVNREYLRRSTVQNLAEYVNAEWVHFSNYTGKPIHEIDGTVEDGMSVENMASTWQIQAAFSSATGANWVTSIIGQKMASFTSGGVIVQ